MEEDSVGIGVCSVDGWALDWELGAAAVVVDSNPPVVGSSPAVVVWTAGLDETIGPSV